MPAVREHLTPKYYVAQTSFHNVDESSLLSLYPHEKLKLNEQDSKIHSSTLTSPKTIIELPNKSYVDSLHETVETDVIYHQCLMIKMMNFIILN